LIAGDYSSLLSETAQRIDKRNSDLDKDESDSKILLQDFEFLKVNLKFLL